jgi:hypothetical protein
MTMDAKTRTPIDREDEKFNQGVAHAMQILADRLGDPVYYAADGSEDYDTDLGDTFMNMLAAKGLYDKNNGAFAALAVPSRADAREEGEITPTLVYDRHPESPRLMYETEAGRFTQEQYFILQMMERIEVTIAALRAQPVADGEVLAYLREVNAGTDNACWVICAKGDPGAVAVTRS